MPNTLAYIVLFIWPLVVFQIFRKNPLDRAFIISILVGYLFIPTKIAVDLPLIPALDKINLTNISIILALYGKLPLKNIFLIKDNILRLIIAFGLLGAVVTVLNNAESLVYGSKVISGLSFKDAISQSIDYIIKLIPFLVAAYILDNEKSRNEFVICLFLAGMLYSILMIFEIRFSPQINKWLYGYFPHSWQQQKREDGFRPVVFLEHGLWVAMFAALCVIAAAYLSQNNKKNRPGFAGNSTFFYLFTVLFFCKSLGALILASFASPLAKFGSVSLILKVSLVLSLLAILYPTLRYMDLIPTEKLIEIASSIDADRAKSLNTRFVNEDILIQKAQIKPMTGWGGWGRNRIYNDEGENITITDGYWIIIFGRSGWMGYISIFGLMFIGIYRSYKARHGNNMNSYGASTIIALMLSINMIDLLPNASVTPILWLMAGSLVGNKKNIPV